MKLQNLSESYVSSVENPPLIESRPRTPPLHAAIPSFRKRGSKGRGVNLLAFPRLGFGVFGLENLVAVAARPVGAEEARRGREAGGTDFFPVEISWSSLFGW